MVRDENMNIIIEWRIVAKSTSIEWPYMTPILNGNVSAHSIHLKLKNRQISVDVVNHAPHTKWTGVEHKNRLWF